MSQVLVEKQETSNHSLILMETEGQSGQSRKYATLRYQNWRRYSKESLLATLQRENLDYNRGATVQQICDKLDKILGKAVDELTPMEERKVRINRTILSHIQTKKR